MIQRVDVTEYGVRRLIIVAGVMAASLLQTLDSTITNVALPTIQGNLGASQEEATWVVTGYTIAALIVIPLTPWLQNQFGRRNYFVASIIGFTLASIACGAAENLGFLIFARVVQGAFGGGLLVTAQSILRDTFPPEKLGTSQGIFALGAIMGPALGPPLGGLLVDHYSWNWCFDINIAPGIFAAIVLALMLRDPDKATSVRTDFIGLALLAVGVGSLQYVLTEGEQNYWLADPTIAFMLVIALTSLLAFCLYELWGTDTPVVDLRILKNRSVWAGSVLGFALGVAIFGSTYTIPQFTQGELGFTPTLSGMLFILRAVPVAICTPLVVRFSSKVDIRIFIGVGFALLGLANMLQGYATTLQASFVSFVAPLILSGMGAALLWSPLAIAMLRVLSPRESPKASAFLNLSVQLGGSIAVATMDVLIHNREQFHSSVLSGAMSSADPVVRHFLGGHSLAELAQIIYAQATALSYADANFVIALVTMLCVPLLFLMRSSAASSGTAHKHVEVEPVG